jgi:ketosteroid isomerase-like protein
MKKFYLVLIAVILFGCHSRSSYTKDEQKVSLWKMDYTKYIYKTDIEQLLSLFTDDVIFLPPNQPQFSGKENLRKWFINYFNYCSPVEHLHISNMNSKGDFAYLVGRYQVTLKVKDSGETLNDKGKSVFLFERQKGMWKCTYSIWNSDKPTLDLHFQIPQDFSGTWELDKNRSTSIPDLMSSRMIIEQRGNNITVNQAYNFKDKSPFERSTNYNIGSEQKTETKSGSFITSSFWREDNQSFKVIEKLLFKNNGVTKEYKRTTSYSITSEGEILNIISDDLLPDGVNTLMNQGHSEMIFNRL